MKRNETKVTKGNESKGNKWKGKDRKLNGKEK